jgi:hypothetical protein
VTAGCGRPSRPVFRLEVDLAVRDGPEVRRRHVRHDLRGRRVSSVSLLDSGETTLESFAVEDWRDHLVRLAEVATPPGDPPPVLDVPWHLLVAGRARHDLDPVLVGRTVGRVRADGEVLGAARCDVELARLWRTTVGRLRAVGQCPLGRRVGWLSWLLLPGGWHALCPHAVRSIGGSHAMVRVEPRRAADLADDVARWAVGVPW